MISSIMFSLGYIVPSLLSFLLPKWNDFMLALSLLSALFIPISLLIPESPQFLWTIGNFSKAEEVLQTFARRRNIELQPGKRFNSSNVLFIEIITTLQGLLKRVTQVNQNIDMSNTETIRKSIRQMSSYTSGESWRDLIKSCFFVRTLLSIFFMVTAVAGVYCGLGSSFLKP